MMQEAGVPFRRSVQRGLGKVLLTVPLLAAFLGDVSGAMVQRVPLSTSSLEAFAFDPFSLETDTQLLSFYQSAFVSTAPFGGTTLLPGGSVEPVPLLSEPTGVSTSVSGSLEPAPTTATLSDWSTPTGGTSTTLYEASDSLLIDPRLPKRTPILPEWP